MHKRNQERNWQTGMGASKVHQELPTFEFSLSNTSCSTSMWNFGFIAGTGAYELCKSCYFTMLAREVELKGEDLVPELSPLVVIFWRSNSGGTWMTSGNDGRTCFNFLGVNLFVSSRPLFWACFIIQKKVSCSHQRVSGCRCTLQVQPTKKVNAF